MVDIKKKPDREDYDIICFSLDPKSAVAIFLDRHNKAETSKTTTIASIGSSSVASTLAGTSDGCTNVVQEDTTDLREFLTRLLKNIDFHGEYSC